MGSSPVLRPVPEAVFLGVFRGLFADPDFQVAIRIASVLFFDHAAFSPSKTTDGLISKVRGIPQVGVEGYANFIPVADLTLRLIVRVQVRTFQIAKMADVVYRAIGANDPQWFLAPAGKLHAARKDDIKYHVAALIRFTPNAEILGELVPKSALFMTAGTNGQANCRGRPHIRRAPHSAPEGFAQDARYRR